MTFKQELDYYFNSNYEQLIKNAFFLIKKYNRKFSEIELISEAYIYLNNIENKITIFAVENGLTLNHVIYSFFKKFTTMSCVWKNSEINRQFEKYYDKIFSMISIEQTNENDETIYTLTTDNVLEEDNIYTEEFIKSFYDSLDKESKICFDAYYYQGNSTGKELGEYFNMSPGTGANIIKDLKLKLKQYIIKTKIN